MEIVTGFLRRRYWLILLGLLLAVPFGALYLFLTPATYTASALTLIETRKNPLEPLVGGGTPDFAWIESQIGVLRSRNVAAVVVKQLRLADDPTFVRSGIDPLDRFLARLGWEDPESQNRTGACRCSGCCIIQRTERPTCRCKLSGADRF